MTITARIARRLRIGEAKLARAGGRYHSDAPGITDADRRGYRAECRRCQTVVTELRGLREECAAGGGDNNGDAE